MSPNLSTINLFARACHRTQTLYLLGHQLITKRQNSQMEEIHGQGKGRRAFMCSPTWWAVWTVLLGFYGIFITQVWWTLDTWGLNLEQPLSYSQKMGVGTESSNLLITWLDPMPTSPHSSMTYRGFPSHLINIKSDAFYCADHLGNSKGFRTCARNWWRLHISYYKSQYHRLLYSSIYIHTLL